ncbi:hypothetical protein MNBD_GAMMA03-2090 [hydrothermal vent metagenome]|uniref:Peptidoglycan binding-like domain-containing protein n=1 Tax=hydrothermal vent metagenome TaxID=652676 RepID=A0A3B0W4B0_9ZZZZ
MKKLQLITPISVVVAALIASGCSTTTGGNDLQDLKAELNDRQAILNSQAATLDQKEASLGQKEESLNKKEASLSQKEANLKQQGGSLGQKEASFNESAVKMSKATEKPPQMLASDLLPPNAKKGECFARVWESPTYKTISEEVLIKEANEKIAIIPAQYQWKTKTIEVSGATSKLVTKPTVYGSEEVTTLTREARTLWREDRYKNNLLMTDEVIEFAKKHSTDDIAGASPGTCFHEHRKAAKYKEMEEKVLVSEAYEVIETIPAQYKMVDETIVVQEVSTKIIEVPATYKDETKQILVKPATTVWKKGTGPIQRIDSATGEIMCLVDVPAEYKTITTRVIDTPASTKVITIPEVTKIVQSRQEVVPAKEIRRTVPAKYKMVKKTTVESDGELVWHEVHNNTMDTKSRTGRQMCLVSEPAIYKTTTKRIVVTPASTQKVAIPAEYKEIKVKTLLSEASEKRTKIPAVYKTIYRQELIEDGQMEWRSILCETNMTRVRVEQIQQALKAKGYNPGSIDGVVGSQTIHAMNQFQKANNLPVDKYLNVESIRALGVSEK